MAINKLKLFRNTMDCVPSFFNASTIDLKQLGNVVLYNYLWNTTFMTEVLVSLCRHIFKYVFMVNLEEAEFHSSKKYIWWRRKQGRLSWQLLKKCQVIILHIACFMKTDQAVYNLVGHNMGDMIQQEFCSVDHF